MIPTDVGRRCVECGANFLSRLPFRRCPACRELPKVSYLDLLAAVAIGGVLGAALARGGLYSWFGVGCCTAVAAGLLLVSIVMR